MAKWTVALFGHYKPKDLGWERRAMPGDLIAFKPYGEDWTDNEKRHFLIVTIVGFTEEHWDALAEHLWDLNSYELYKPMTQPVFETWVLDQLAQQTDSAARIVAFLNNKSQFYIEYFAGVKERCELPRRGLKKRRFHIPLAELKQMGVNESDMLEKEKLYVPEIDEIDYLDITDKMRERKILITDILKGIQPLTTEEMIAKASI